jgi:hypothetical protein
MKGDERGAGGGRDNGTVGGGGSIDGDEVRVGGISQGTVGARGRLGGGEVRMGGRESNFFSTLPRLILALCFPR